MPVSLSLPEGTAAAYQRGHGRFADEERAWARRRSPDASGDNHHVTGTLVLDSAGLSG